MWTTIRYVVLTAVRDRLFVGLLAGMLAAAMISMFLGDTAFLEQKEATVTFAAGSLRMILAVGLVVFVCFHIRSAFDNREMDVLLSRPISRSQVVLAYAAGFAVVASLLVLPFAVVVRLLSPGNVEGFGAWAISFWLESMLVVAISLFCSLTLRSAVSAVLASLGLYVLSRMMAFFILTAQSGFFHESYFLLMKYALILISMVFPRLDLFAKSDWLVYGLRTGAELQVCAAQAVVFVALLLAASVVDFLRKEF